MYNRDRYLKNFSEFIDIFYKNGMICGKGNRQMKILQNIKVGAKLFILTLPLIVCIIAAVVFTAVQIDRTEEHVTSLYYDTLYQVNSALVNADRDFYQTMMAATQYYDLNNDYTDLPSQIRPPYLIQKWNNFEENRAQVYENVAAANEIAKTNTELYTVIQADDGLTFAEAWEKFETGYAAWDSAFDLKENSGNWDNYNSRFSTARSVLNDMQLITETWAEQEHAALEKENAATIRNSAIVFGILIVLLAALAVIISKHIAGSIKEITQKMDMLAEGRLDVDFPIDERIGSDEVGQMLHSAKEVAEKFREVIEKAKRMSEELTAAGTNLSGSASQAATASGQVTDAVTEISKGAAAQAESVENAAGDTDDIGTNIESIASDIHEMDRFANEMQASCDQAMDALNVLMKHSVEVTRSVKDVGDTIASTNDSVKGISEFTQAIADIASETNLLSLNASIEAARAGEAGRGFAVVADEIRQLADQSNTSAENIRAIVDKLLQDSEASVTVLSKLNESFKVQEAQLGSTKTDMENMSVNVSSVRETSGNISGRISSLTGAKNNLTAVISDLSAISEENAASTQETNASMEELNATFSLISESASKLQELALELADTISYFKV